MTEGVGHQPCTRHYCGWYVVCLLRDTKVEVVVLVAVCSVVALGIYGIRLQPRSCMLERASGRERVLNRKIKKSRMAKSLAMIVAACNYIASSGRIELLFQRGSCSLALVVVQVETRGNVNSCVVATSGHTDRPVGLPTVAEFCSFFAFPARPA